MFGISVIRLNDDDDDFKLFALRNVRLAIARSASDEAIHLLHGFEPF
jgi:hypothetical protein